MPFGGGRRSCAGKDLARIMLKVFVVEHVRGCSVRLLNERTRFQTFPMPYPTDGMPVNVTCL
ncbi:hypothetical protein DPMN_067486 [Dreissena polymorpha]|uniref:Cytochrome P450 n=2 Tax=Dreissena polymorpha TaxID=45954 RepID=A0A9D4BTL1_DREPO|nr:hypothetical protein DPMN_067486 [Dreissena polymorpha]